MAVHSSAQLYSMSCAYLLNEVQNMDLVCECAVDFHFQSLKDPLEAILVIFGRRALIFFCLKGLGKI